MKHGIIIEYYYSLASVSELDTVWSVQNWEYPDSYKKYEFGSDPGASVSLQKYLYQSKNNLFSTCEP